MKHQLFAVFVLSFLLVLSSFFPDRSLANPYLPKPDEASIKVRLGTCSLTGAFIHLGTAIDNGIFDKYGLRVEHVAFRGSGVSLAALNADEIQFLSCAASATLPGIVTGIDAKFIGSQLVGLPWVVLGRNDIRSPADLKGKTIAVSRAGDLSHRLAMEVLKKFKIGPRDVTIQPVGGTGQMEGYRAMVSDQVQAVLVSPPLDAIGKRDGFNIVYRLKDLGIPFVYSSLHANMKSILTRPVAVQRFVAAIADTLYFADRNPAKAQAALAKAMKLTDSESLQTTYEAFAKTIANRRMTVPIGAIEEMIEHARESGTQARKKAIDIVDNRFADDLAKSGFLNELWGKEMAK
jgi:NitT/TauT family transport system substrate-binding protein